MTTMSKFYRPNKPVLNMQANRTNLGSSDISSADSEDQDLTKLDENSKSTDTLSENAKGKGIVVNKELPTPNELLLIALLEQFSIAYEKDQEKGQQLFKALCTQLAHMQMLNPGWISWMDDNLSPLRSQTKKNFNYLINIGHAQVHKISPTLTENGARSMEPRLAGLHPVNITASDQFNFHTSRYRDEFYELGVVGKGAYGKVFKAKHKMDSCVYAVKKIIFADATEEMWSKIQREMRHLASLPHPHIVRYCTAWLEQEPVTSPVPCPAGDSPIVHSDSSHGAQEQGSGYGLSWRPLPYPVRESSKGDIAEASNKSETDVEILKIMANTSRLENSATSDIRISSDVTKDGAISNSDTEDSIVFQDTSINGVKNGVTYGVINDVTDKVSHPDDAKDSVVFVEESQSSHGSVLPEFSSKPMPQTPPPAYCRIFRVVMYIQMELCDMTLKDWINRRNETLKAAVVDPVPCLHIIKQVLHAVEHIHANDLMHRDLKPQNIFVNKKKDIKAKVGDFGLSRQLNTDPPESPMTRETSATIPMTPHPGTSITPPLVGTKGEEEKFTSGVGTPSYAAPEQLEGSQYNEKSDVYSLGLIMYELYWVFRTAMELGKCLGDARKGVLHDAFCEQWPTQSKYIKRMLATDPEDRPTVRDVLQGELFRCKDESEYIKGMLATDPEDRPTVGEVLQGELSRCKDKIKDLNQELKVKDEKLKERNEELKEKNEELKRKDEKISQLSREMAEIRQELAR